MGTEDALYFRMPDTEAQTWRERASNYVQKRQRWITMVDSQGWKHVQ